MSPPNSAPLNDLHTSSPVGKFELLRRIAVGGCGAVYLGKHQRLGYLRAVKVLFARTAGVEEEAIRLYKQAIRIADYCVLVPVEDFDSLDDGSQYYVMPLADHVGPPSLYLPEQYEPLTLKARLRDVGPLSVEEVLEIADRLLLALRKLHGYGLLHLDIKPDNVVRIEGKWRLGDFGIMIKRANAHSVGQRGTKAYRPPEPTPDFTSDIYSLGVTLLVLATDCSTDHFPANIPSTLKELKRRDRSHHTQQLCAIIARACDQDANKRPTINHLQEEVSGLIGKVWRTIRLPVSAENWNPKMQAAWKAIIEELGGPIQREDVEFGSVLYRLQLTPAQADYLDEAIRSGDLPGGQSVQLLIPEVENQEHETLKISWGDSTAIHWLVRFLAVQAAALVLLASTVLLMYFRPLTLAGPQRVVILPIAERSEVPGGLITLTGSIPDGKEGIPLVFLKPHSSPREAEHYPWYVQERSRVDPQTNSFTTPVTVGDRTTQPGTVFTVVVLLVSQEKGKQLDLWVPGTEVAKLPDFPELKRMTFVRR